MVTDTQHSVLASIRDFASRLKRRATEPPMNVLIVDDEEPVREFVDRVLSEAGHKTTAAGGGPEAIDLAMKMDAVDVPRHRRDDASDRLFKEKVTEIPAEASASTPATG